MKALNKRILIKKVNGQSLSHKQQMPAYEPITIKEPYKADVIHFNDVDEFTQYYREHEVEMKELSTLKLNKTFKIPGYRISVRNRGKEDEELYLKKDYYGGSKNEESTVEDESTTSCVSDTALTNTIDELRQRIENIETFLQQLRC